MTQKIRGFTLVETMAVVAMIGILVAVAAPTFKDAIRRRQVDKFAHEVASVIYQARATAMIKRRMIQLSYRPGFILIITREDQNVVGRYPVDPTVFYDQNFSITAQDSRSFINANGFLVNVNSHPMTEQTIQIFDAMTKKTLSFVISHAGSVDWS